MRREETACASKLEIADHPVHPMPVALPVAFSAGTLAGLAMHAADGHLSWLSLAIALSLAGSGTAALAGPADLALGIPEPAAKRHRLSLRHQHAA